MIAGGFWHHLDSDCSRKASSCAGGSNEEDIKIQITVQSRMKTSCKERCGMRMASSKRYRTDDKE